MLRHGGSGKGRWEDMADTDSSAAPASFLSWRYGEHDIRQRIEELSQVDHPTLSLVECTYHMGYYEEAATAAALLMESGTLPERLVAGALALSANIAIPHIDQAMAALDRIAVDCATALTGAEGDFGYVVARICAGIVEERVSMPCIEYPRWNGDFSEMHPSLQGYAGFQMAYEALVGGRDQEAIGVARAFLAVVGREYPVTRVKLLLAMSSAHLRLRRQDQAVEAFRRAWDEAAPFGIVAPFVELAPVTPGLARHCLMDGRPEAYRIMRSMGVGQRAGWHQLRERLGNPAPGDMISALEYSAGALAIWGWPNREIASFLGISDNTVKHYLSNVYQKLGVGSRGELSGIIVGG